MGMLLRYVFMGMLLRYVCVFKNRSTVDETERLENVAHP